MMCLEKAQRWSCWTFLSVDIVTVRGCFSLFTHLVWCFTRNCLVNVVIHTAVDKGLVKSLMWLNNEKCCCLREITRQAFGAFSFNVTM